MKNKYFEKIIEILEEKSGWGSIDKWRERNISILSDKIKDTSGIIISTQTLKRIFGKVKSEKDYFPNETTLNALAKHIGYPSWAKFEDDVDKNYVQIPKNKAPLLNNEVKINPHSIKNISIAFSILLLITIFYFRSFIIPPKIVIIIPAQINTAPTTVKIKYSVSRTLGNKFYIDFGDSKINKDAPPQLLNLKNKEISHYYPFTGIYHISIKQGLFFTKSYHILIPSNNWLRVLDGKPKGLRLGNISENKGYLYISKSEIENSNIDTSFYQSDFSLYRNYNLSADSLQISMKIKQHYLTQSNSICNYMFIYFYTEDNFFTVKYTDTTCFSNSDIGIGKDVVLIGSKDNLSFMGINFSEWKNIKITTKNKKLILESENKKLTEIPYKSNLGELIGIHIFYSFDGMLDDVTILNSYTSKLIYKENFDSIVVNTP